MKSKIKLMASAMAIAATVSGGAYAAELPSVTTHQLGVGTTPASFAGGVTLNDGAGFIATSVPSTSTTDFMGQMTVDPADVGQSAGLLMVLRITGSGIPGGTSWVQKNSSGDWVAWDTKVSGLVPYETRTLSAVESISEPALVAPGDNMEGTEVSVFFGYMVGSKLVYSFSPVKFDVTAPFTSCPSGTTLVSSSTLGGKNLCKLTGTYTTDMHLSKEFDYILSGAVVIGNDDNTGKASLTIDPGITIYGESGNDILLINRGSKLYANGNKEGPIIMTSAGDADATASTRGEWGGLILNGNAPINGCTEGTALCEAEGEGSTGLYGGNDPHDSSGVLNYMVVKYAGFLFNSENELNGIAWQGVGNGTVADYLQIHNNADDGMEFFGGTINVKHIVLTGNADDSFDFTGGFQGRAQFIMIQQTDTGDRGFEMDNNGKANDSLPRSKPIISNVTVLGNANTTQGLLLRAGTGANFSNTVVVDSGSGCIDIDDQSTYDHANDVREDGRVNLTINNSLVDCDPYFVSDGDETSFTVQSWYEGQAENHEGGSGMVGGISKVNWINTSAVNAITPSIPDDPFFDDVDYIGAIKDADHDWTAGWTFTDF